MERFSRDSQSESESTEVDQDQPRRSESLNDSRDSRVRESTSTANIGDSNSRLQGMQRQTTVRQDIPVQHEVPRFAVQGGPSQDRPVIYEPDPLAIHDLSAPVEGSGPGNTFTWFDYYSLMDQVMRLTMNGFMAPVNRIRRLFFERSQRREPDPGPSQQSTSSIRPTQRHTSPGTVRPSSLLQPGQMPLPNSPTAFRPMQWPTPSRIINTPPSGGMSSASMFPHTGSQTLNPRQQMTSPPNRFVHDHPQPPSDYPLPHREPNEDWRRTSFLKQRPTFLPDPNYPIPRMFSSGSPPNPCNLPSIPGEGQQPTPMHSEPGYRGSSGYLDTPPFRDISSSPQDIPFRVHMARMSRQPVAGSSSVSANMETTSTSYPPPSRSSYLIPVDTSFQTQPGHQSNSSVPHQTAYSPGLLQSHAPLESTVQRSYPAPPTRHVPGQQREEPSARLRSISHSEMTPPSCHSKRKSNEPGKLCPRRRLRLSDDSRQPIQSNSFSNGVLQREESSSNQPPVPPTSVVPTNTSAIPTTSSSGFELQNAGGPSPDDDSTPSNASLSSEN